MKFLKTALILFNLLAAAEDVAYAKPQIWFRVLDNCRKAGNTTQVLATLRKDEQMRNLSNCFTEEKLFLRGKSLYRNCDGIEGYELFGSTKRYCQWLANPKMDTLIRRGRLK